MDTNSQDNYRKEFLLKMYEQLCSEINRSILLVWQAVGVLVSAFALFSLVEKSIIPIDVAVSLLVLLSAWLTSHIYNSNYWYNRNLAIIANIEKQFLFTTDQLEIHYYFGQHRATKSVLSELKIQLFLILGLDIIVLLYHIFDRIIPIINKSVESDFACWTPYIVLIGAAIYVITFKRKLDRKYMEFKENSPGKNINTIGIKFGEGHPIDK